MCVFISVFTLKREDDYHLAFALRELSQQRLVYEIYAGSVHDLPGEMVGKEAGSARRLTPP